MMSRAEVASRYAMEYVKAGVRLTESRLIKSNVQRRMAGIDRFGESVARIPFVRGRLGRSDFSPQPVRLAVCVPSSGLAPIANEIRRAHD